MQASRPRGMSRRAPIEILRTILEDRVYAEHLWAYVLLIPAIIFFGAFTVLPVGRALIMSFQNFTAFTAQRDFVGLDNYRLFITTNQLFWKSIVISAIYTVAVVPPHVFVPLILAALISRLHGALQTFFKSAYYLPTVVAGVTMSLTWLWILYPLETGMANQLMKALGLPPRMWLAEELTALPSLIAIAALSGWGGGIILYLAAMGSIPKTLYEAANLDCASGLSKFFNITLPLIKPTMLFLIVTGTIGSFQVFESAYVLTQGGPNNSTKTFVYLIFQTAFMNFDFGQAAAGAVMLAVVVIAAAVIQFKWMTTQVEY